MCSAERDNPPDMLGRVLGVLDAFSPEEPALSISELSRRTGLPKASTSRIVHSMVGYQLLEADGRRYRLGIRLFELGAQVAKSADLRKLAFPFMSELMRVTQQTVHLAVLEGIEVVYVLILRSRATPQLPSRVGGRLPAHATGVGKALLAYAPAETVAALVSRPLVAVGPRTITDPVALAAELDSIRQNRLAYEREEAAADAGCAAAPILDSRHRALAAMSVSVRLGDCDLPAMGQVVSGAARALSRQLGASG